TPCMNCPGAVLFSSIGLISRITSRGLMTGAPWRSARILNIIASRSALALTIAIKSELSGGGVGVGVGGGGGAMALSELQSDAGGSLESAGGPHPGGGPHGEYA